MGAQRFGNQTLWNGNRGAGRSLGDTYAGRTPVSVLRVCMLDDERQTGSTGE